MIETEAKDITSGDQFVAIWVYCGKPWSSAFEIVSGSLYQYNVSKGGFKLSDFPNLDYIAEMSESVKFFKTGE